MTKVKKNIAHPNTARELIAMARDPRKTKEEVVDAYILHYIPGTSGSYDEFLSVLALERPEIFLAMGVTLAHLKHTHEVLHALQKHQLPEYAS